MSSTADGIDSGNAMPRAAKLLLRILARIKHGRLEIITPDGQLRVFVGETPGPQAMLRMNDWGVCNEILRAGDIGFAESYIGKRWETADLTRVLALAALNHAAIENAIYGSWLGGLLYRLRHLFRRNTRGNAKKNIHAHYDLGNSFYKLWLDQSMTYSSALFEGRLDRTLEEAQRIKYDRILERLAIKPGQRVLEIGCGWGGFVEYAATERKCKVHGITLSREQLAYTKERISRAGLGDQVSLELRDYRDVQGEFDHVVSIEMFEAVGEKYWPDFFRAVRSRLVKGGQALIQTITIAESLFDRYRLSTDFIQQYIFPGGMLPSVEVFRDVASREGLLVGEPNQFRLDYAETLRRWRHAFNSSLGELQRLGFDERFFRLWNFYLAYCEAGFRAGTIDVMQVELKRV